MDQKITSTDSLIANNICKVLADVNSGTNINVVCAIASDIVKMLDSNSLPCSFIMLNFLPKELTKLSYVFSAVLQNIEGIECTFETDRYLPDAYVNQLAKLKGFSGSRLKNDQIQVEKITTMHVYLSNYLIKQHRIINKLSSTVQTDIDAILSNSEYQYIYVNKLASEELKNEAKNEIKNIASNFHDYFDTSKSFWVKSNNALAEIKKEIQKFIQHCKKLQPTGCNNLISSIENYFNRNQLHHQNIRFTADNYDDILNICWKEIPQRFLRNFENVKDGKPEHIRAIFNKSLLPTQPDEFLLVLQKLKRLNESLENQQINSNSSNISSNDYMKYFAHK